MSDPEKRQEYDETGTIYDDDDVNETSVDEWRQYFRGMFPKVTISSINKFEVQYKKSDEEKADVLKYYKACKGDLNKMITCVMLSEESDKQRWYKDFISPAIKNGDVPNYEAMLKKTMGGKLDEDDEETESEEDEKPVRKPKKAKAKSKKEKEAEEAEELLAKIRGNALARKERSFNGILSSLENKYADKDGKRKKRSKKVLEDDIPDDEFERMRNEVEANRASKKTRK